jgi:hypothetical protein
MDAADNVTAGNVDVLWIEYIKRTLKECRRFGFEPLLVC